MGRKVYLMVAAVFLIFVVSFVIYQYAREKQYKMDTLENHLQDYNRHMYETLSVLGRSEAGFNRYLSKHPVKNQRVTAFNKDGHVIFDNHHKDYASMDNHTERPEITAALKYGKGSAVRMSSTFKEQYFYSATYFKDKGYIIRTALPYDHTLEDALKADQHYLWFALVSFVVLIIGLQGFMRRLGKNVRKLRLFASRVDHGENIDLEEFGDFPHDDVGEIAQRIITLYKRLETTKNEQDELKRQLTENVAHELKTPVASINGFLETLINNPDIDEDTRNQYLTRCYAQSERLSNLLRDISTLNIMDDAPMLRVREDVNINEIIENHRRNGELELKSRQMTIDNRLPEGVNISGYRPMLIGIFANLISNSLVYAGEGTTITIEAERKGEMWHFTFRDNGVGVPPEHLERIFERFYRVDKGRSRKLGGTGLGLSIVKNIVLQHGGTITASNLPEGGLCFDFDLPAAE